MYEYAATDICAIKYGTRFCITYIAIGSPVPPIIPITPASFMLKPKSFAPIKAIKIHMCAAVPSII